MMEFPFGEGMEHIVLIQRRETGPEQVIQPGSWSFIGSWAVDTMISMAEPQNAGYKRVMGMASAVDDTFFNPDNPVECEREVVKIMKHLADQPASLGRLQKLKEKWDSWRL